MCGPREVRVELDSDGVMTCPGPGVEGDPSDTASALLRTWVSFVLYCTTKDT